MNQRLKSYFQPQLIAIVCAAFMLLSIFFPYAHATKSFAEELSRNSTYYSSQGIYYKDLTHPSLFTYVKIYEKITPEGAKAFGCFLTAIVAASALTLFFSFRKRPIAMIIFNAISLLLFSRITKFHNGFINQNNYNLSITYYLFIISSNSLSMQIVGI